MVQILPCVEGEVAYYYLPHLMQCSAHNTADCMSSKGWCFTCFYDGDEQHDVALLHLQLLSDSPDCAYIVAGRESCPTTGRTHFQGYVYFNRRLALSSVRNLLPQSHLTRARGSVADNRAYCTKDGDFEEFGTPPAHEPGKRSDLDAFRDWCLQQQRKPNERVLAREFPGLFLRYRQSLLRMVELLCPQSSICDGSPNPGWQSELLESISLPASDRTVDFFVDPNGGSGKSWFCQYAYSTLEGVQVLGPGKRDDLAYAIREENWIFLFNIPRGSMEFLNYGLLEQIKDRMVLSSKYESKMKILENVPHVVVFCNEMPDMTKMTQDRYVIHELS